MAGVYVLDDSSDSEDDPSDNNSDSGSIGIDPGEFPDDDGGSSEGAEIVHFSEDEEPPPPPEAAQAISPEGSPDDDARGIFDHIRDHIDGKLPVDEDASQSKRKWVWFMEQIVRMLYYAKSEDPVGDVVERIQRMVTAIRNRFDTVGLITDPMDPAFDHHRVFEAQMANDMASQIVINAEAIFGSTLDSLPWNDFLALVRRVFMVYSHFANHPRVGADLREIWGEVPPEYKSPKSDPPIYQEGKRRRPDDDDGAAPGPPVFAGVASMFTQR